METPAKFEVHQLSGAVLEVDACGLKNVGDLKAEIGKVRKVPPLCVGLLFGDSKLEDADPLETFTEVARKSLTMVVSTQMACLQADIQGVAGARQARLQAVEALAGMGSVKDVRVVETLSARLDDSDVSVKLAAVKALAQLERSENDHEVFTKLCRRCRDPSEHFSVRAASIGALANFTHQGRLGASEAFDLSMTSLVRNLSCHVESVRATAVEIVAMAAPWNWKVPQISLAPLRTCVRHHDNAVKHVVVRTLAGLVSRSDDETIFALASILEDDQAEVITRRVAAGALCRVIREGYHGRAVMAFRSCERDADSVIQRAAAACINRVKVAS
eukprot:TRINITY_DN37604_c0_g1_i1.p1 TRINITY_DN37604_c0_g1~~TRINITY_DN37604_c0_g1_i1.p1  ORF type:complete len:331 (-),score=39.62 TRINITY_DN37604_c0_g1_i1:456-1448(-)